VELCKAEREHGKGFGERTLRDARQFYRTFPIWREVRAKLGWTQHRRIMRLKSAEAREFYASECEASNWSEAELKRNIDTYPYERLLRGLPTGNGGDEYLSWKTTALKGEELRCPSSRRWNRIA
jgi:hypothetical protein